MRISFKDSALNAGLLALTLSSPAEALSRKVNASHTTFSAQTMDDGSISCKGNERLCIKFAIRAAKVSGRNIILSYDSQHGPYNIREYEVTPTGKYMSIDLE